MPRGKQQEKKQVKASAKTPAKKAVSALSEAARALSAKGVEARRQKSAARKAANINNSQTTVAAASHSDKSELNLTAGLPPLKL